MAVYAKPVVWASHSFPIADYLRDDKPMSPLKYKTTAYHRQIFRDQLSTRHTFIVVEMNIYTVSQEPPPVRSIDPSLLRGLASIDAGYVPKPDILTQFDAWFDWQCFMTNAPLSWVQCEHDRVAFNCEQLESRYGRPLPEKQS